MYKLLIILSIIAFSCKPGKESAGAKNGNGSAANATVATDSQASTNSSPMNNASDKEGETYRLIINLISIGEGIDSKAKSELDEFIRNYNEKNHVSITYLQKGWGREGETDIMFTLKELDQTKQIEFINAVRSLFKGRELIQFEENMKNRFNRK